MKKVSRGRIKTANVRAKVFLNGSHKTLAETNMRMPTDLPVDSLGELLAEAINLAWKDGNDPINFEVVISFS